MWQSWRLIKIEDWLWFYEREDWTINCIWINHLSLKDWTMTNAEKLAQMMCWREYRNETTDEMVQFAKEHNLIICTWYSDDNVILYWAFEEEVWISETGSFHIIKHWDHYERVRLDDMIEELMSIDSELLKDIACEKVQKYIEEEWIEIKVEVDYEGSWYYFDMSHNNRPTFEIMEDWEKYCMWCIIDMSLPF